MTIPILAYSFTLGADHAYFSTYGLSVYGALFTNGLLLNIFCGHHVPSATPPQSGLTPASLHPTALQRKTVHSQWIDQFPFPRLRDNLILMSAIYDGFEEMFQHDLFTAESIEICVGGASWEAKDWRIHHKFKERWSSVFA